MTTKWKIVKTGIGQYRAYQRFSRLSNTQKDTSTVPEQFVHNLLNLGPVFIKVGQILSTRPDVLPIQYIVALQKLQENTPSFDFHFAKQIIEQELGQPVEQVFESVEEKPAASASLSQVHFGVLKSGDKVALKVQRPNVKSDIENDLKKIGELILIFKFLFPQKEKRSNLYNGFLEFKRYTIRELDFALEGETIERFKKNFTGWNDVLFPEIYKRYSTEKLLVMGRIFGLRLQEVSHSFSREMKEKLTVRLSEMELKMFISDGLFHADLHPGNIIFKEDGKIVLLDFGMYGELSTEERNRFVLYWLAVVQNEVKRAFYHFKRQCKELPHANEESFYAVFKKLADDFFKSRLQEVSITKVYLNMIRAGYKYGYIFPENLLLHAKALTTAEALTFELSPDARFEEITKPIISKEFARMTLDGGLIRSKVEQTLPEFLLTGEIPPSSFQGNNNKADETNFLWEAMYNQVIQKIKIWQGNAGFFRSIVNPSAHEILKNEFDEEFVQLILKNTRQEYTDSEAALPKQQTLGATFTIHGACVTVALYNNLLKSGKTKDDATRLIYEVGWRLYTRMSEIPMLMAGLFSENAHKRMELATKVFRMFPFTAPDYGWEEVQADDNTVAFNCTRCHVAEYFKKLNLGDVCYNTWCKLDFSLAEQWGGKLERTGSIAGGAEKCDFRWITKKS